MRRPRLRPIAAFAALLGIVSVIKPLGAYVFGFSNGGRWPSSTVVMNLELGSSNGALADGCVDWGQCAEYALSLWNPYLNSTQFRVVRNSTVPRVNHDGVNVVFWASDVYGTAFGDRTLAITALWERGTAITDADVLFNTAKSFNSYRGALRSNGVHDFRRVAAHEFGHVLGLDHPDEAGQIVGALMNSVESNIEVPQSDDISGVAALYGATTPPPRPALRSS